MTKCCGGGLGETSREESSIFLQQLSLYPQHPEKGGHPLHVQDKYVIAVSAWFFDLLGNILKFNLRELTASLQVIGTKVLSANTKNCLSGREHCKNRETFLKHNVVFQWNCFSSSEYHLLHKYVATKVTTRNNLFLKNPYVPKGKIVLWCEDTTLT